jgi:hypothetical protein
MWHEFEADARFCTRLLEIDEAIAKAVQEAGCRRCKGRLDRADYPRKPRGAEIAPQSEVWKKRISLCCSKEGCRKRSTPPSARFLGRRVYTAAVVLVAPPILIEGMRKVAGVPLRTVRRWLVWWQDGFVNTRFFRTAKSRISRGLSIAELPAALIRRFGGSPLDQVERTLRFLSPITTASVRDGSRFAMAGA